MLNRANHLSTRCSYHSWVMFSKVKELTSLPKYDDKAVAAILDKYTPKFKPLNHMRFSAKSVLVYYVRVIRKEIKNG
ncbi:hypothetical protein XBKQ1_1140005 [Xenorhabdus bovienii str. kraussei Quebec]|uniref:Uncharacterized protein n=2 Tax=Xenorhabdus bovienii TaxID=40576 RepID=A0A077PBI0_XENBV|nr:hypothetical protein XBKQ1_1140005 [Xenorhabdus bovienii str. kraussei Quebec]CDH32604.1 hypothetical protein XBI1_2030003 [Xenorhabdus bovienii str. Intermedium]